MIRDEEKKQQQSLFLLLAVFGVAVSLTDEFFFLVFPQRIEFWVWVLVAAYALNMAHYL